MYSLDSFLRISWFLQLWRPLVFLCICCFWALYAVAQADEPKGKPQPSVSGKPQDSAAKKPQPSDGGTSNTKPDSNTLLNSPDAREVAPYVCSHKHESDCPLTQEIETMIKQHFRQPLQNGRKGDTELAVAIKNLLNQEYAGAPIWESKISYAVIHLVDEGSGDAGVMPNRWILAQRKRKGIELSESLRILGAKNITVIFLHVRAETGADDPRDAFGDISYRAIVEHKIPVNLSNLFGVLKFAIANAKPSPQSEVSFMGYGMLADIDTPADVTIFSVRTSQNELIGQSRKFDDEGKYLWDVSLGVPVNKLSLLDFSENGNTVTPKQLNKQSVYALFNIYPIPVDLKAGNLRWFLPRAIGGIGLTGRPGENFMVGGAFGLPQIQVFVGSAFANHRIPISGTTPASPLDVKQRYASRLTYGLNVPVLSALEKLKNKK